VEKKKLIQMCKYKLIEGKYPKERLW
jgi:hypothetical protein